MPSLNKAERIRKAVADAFRNTNQLADAKRVLSLMEKTRMAVASVVIPLVCAPVLFFLDIWPFGVFYLILAVVAFLVQQSDVRDARRELDEIMEFEHIQFPYWKSIAERLKKILEEDGAYRKSMLPSHVVDGKS